jgi:hypothetical protein
MKSIKILQDIYEARTPITKCKSIDGDIVVFDDDYIEILDAFMVGKCQNLSSAESGFINNFVSYSNGENSNEQMKALDEQLAQIVNNDPIAGMDDGDFGGSGYPLEIDTDEFVQDTLDKFEELLQ